MKTIFFAIWNTDYSNPIRVAWEKLLQCLRFIKRSKTFSVHCLTFLWLIIRPFIDESHRKLSVFSKRWLTIQPSSQLFSFHVTNQVTTSMYPISAHIILIALLYIVSLRHIFTKLSTYFHPSNTSVSKIRGHPVCRRRQIKLLPVFSDCKEKYL